MILACCQPCISIWRGEVTWYFLKLLWSESLVGETRSRAFEGAILDSPGEAKKFERHMPLPLLVYKGIIWFPSISFHPILYPLFFYQKKTCPCCAEDSCSLMDCLQKFAGVEAGKERSKRGFHIIGTYPCVFSLCSWVTTCFRFTEIGKVYWNRLYRWGQLGGMIQRIDEIFASVAQVRS